MSPSTHDLLRHISDELQYLSETAAQLDEAEFLVDETLKRAFVRSLEVIGEASKNLPAEFRAAHPGVPWKEMAGMRDRLIHGYMGVDYEIVFDVSKNHVAATWAEIRRLVDAESAG